MKLQTEVKEIERGGLVNEMKYSLDAAQLPLLFKLLRTSMYSNKIGSIVREIASNCVDSHIEAGKQDVPIEIEYKEKDNFTGGHEVVVFRDFGVGISEDRMKNIFLKYLSSTKRDTNDQIGGFGLGSKSPFSYTDNFNIVTIVDGKKYNYLAYIDESDLGSIASLMDPVETDEVNGTEIIIPMKNSDDKERFFDEMRKQLCYFENIKFINIPIQPQTIYYADNFVHVKGAYPTTHVLIGRVPYAITSSVVDCYGVRLSIGLKFEIGELSVTPSREQVEFNEATIKAINEKYEASVEEIKALMDVNIDKVETLEEYIAMTNARKSGVLRLDEDVNLEVGAIIKRIRLTPPFESSKYPRLREKVINLAESYSLLYGFEVVNYYKRYAKGNKIEAAVDSGYAGALENFLQKKLIYKDANMSKEAADYFVQVFGNFTVVHRVKKYPIGRACNAFSMKYLNRNKYKQNEPPVWLTTKHNMEFLDQWTDAVEEAIKNNTYSSLSALLEDPDYLAHLAAKEAEAKANREEAAAKLRRRKEQRKIPISLMNRDLEFGWKDDLQPFKLKSTEIKTSTLETYTGMLIYGFQEHLEELRVVYRIYASHKNFLGGYSFENLYAKETDGFVKRDFSPYKAVNDRAVMVCRIAKSNEKYVKANPKSIFIEDFWKMERTLKQIKEVVLATEARKFLEPRKEYGYTELSVNKYGMLAHFDGINDQARKAYLYVLRQAKKVDPHRIDDTLMEQITKAAQEKFRLEEHDLTKTINFLKDYLADAKLLFYIDPSTFKNKDLKEAAKDYLKLKNKRVNL